ncbi:MAG TPA: hypothetical protein VFA23_04815 [Dongiaceae bacterium]|nr:hypothetical protein [Dongiaceae bacterium]
MRSISCVADVRINSVSKLLAEAGETCAAFHDEHMRNVKANRVQCAEIWSFVCTKPNNAAAKRQDLAYGDV